MVAISGNEVPRTTPLARAGRTRKALVVLLRTGVLSFAAVLCLTLRSSDVNEGRDRLEEREQLGCVGPGTLGFDFSDPCNAITMPVLLH